MGAIQTLIDASPDKVIASDASLAQIDAKIAEVQAQQDAFYSALDQIENEINNILITKGEWIFKHSTYHDGTIDANVSDWQVFNIFATDAVFTDVLSFTVPGDQTSLYTSGLLLYFKTTSPEFEIPHGTVSNSISNGLGGTLVTMSMISGDVPMSIDSLLEIVYEKNGVGWDNNNDLIDKNEEYLYIVDYIHKPYNDQQGTYGTKDTLATLNIGRSTIQGNRDKYASSSDSLSRFA